MTLPSVRSCFRALRSHVQNNDRYRWWPLYAAGLAGFLHIAFYWPIDRVTVWVLVERPWVLTLSNVAWKCAVGLCVCLGLVGMLRLSWLARGLSLYALWFGYHYLMNTGMVLQRIWAEITWYAEMFLVAVIWGVLVVGLWIAIWIVIRAQVKRAFPKVGWFEDWLLKQGPRAKQLVRSLM